MHVFNVKDKVRFIGVGQGKYAVPNPPEIPQALVRVSGVADELVAHVKD